MADRWELRPDGPRSQRIVLLAFRIWGLASLATLAAWLLGWSWGRTVLAAVSVACCTLVLAGFVVERRERRAEREA